MSDSAGLKQYWGRLWVLMLTGFVDMMGFLIVLPKLPFLADDLGASPFEVGLLVSVFAAAALVMAPQWGRLSDRYGRRPMIVAGLLLSAGSYVLFEQADSYWLLMLSRIVQGVGSSTVAVLQASLSDVVPRAYRTQAIAWLTSATSAGVMLGPALGYFAQNSGALAPGYLAAYLCLFNALFVWRNLPGGTGVGENAASTGPQPGATRRAFIQVLRSPRAPMSIPVWIYAAGMMAFMSMNAMFALYLGKAFGIDEKSIYPFYAYMGGVSLVVRALIIGRAVRWLGEVRLVRLGILMVGLGMLALPSARNIPQLAIAALFVPMGTALLFPAVTAITSGWARVGEMGTLLGVMQSMGGVSRMVGPIWAGLAFQGIGIRSPFWISCGLLVLAFFFSARLEAGPTGSEATTMVVPDGA